MCTAWFSDCSFKDVNSFQSAARDRHSSYNEERNEFFWIQKNLIAHFSSYWTHAPLVLGTLSAIHWHLRKQSWNLLTALTSLETTFILCWYSPKMWNSNVIYWKRIVDCNVLWYLFFLCFLCVFSPRRFYLANRSSIYNHDFFTHLMHWSYKLHLPLQI